MQYWRPPKCDGACVVKKLVIALLVLITSCGGASKDNAWSQLQVQDVASGNQVSLIDALNGKPTFITLWSVTCTPCKREMPWLQKIADSSKDIGVVGVDIGDDVADIKSFVSSLQLTFPIYRDELGEMLSLLKVTQVPVTFAVNSAGEIVWKHLGALTYEELQKQVLQMS